MIRRLKLLRNIGQFDSVSTGAAIALEKLTLVYAENGRGKTTIAAVLRSLATGDSVPISERKRLGAVHAPHVVLECDGGPPDAQFQNGAWNRTMPDMMVFDDEFVDRNLYSGLAIGTGHRQNLQEIILGAQGVTLKQDVEAKLQVVQQRNLAVRSAEAALPDAIRDGLTVVDFVGLPAQPNIDQRIQASEQRIAALRQQQQVASSPGLVELELPGFRVEEVQALLSTTLPDLEVTAAQRVQEHLARIGANGERWVAEGVTRLRSMEDAGLEGCPFCAQSTTGSDIIAHYRAFFGTAYAELRTRVEEELRTLETTHSSEHHVLLERNVRVNIERRAFWGQFAALPDSAVPTEDIIADWSAATAVIQTALRRKTVSPLEAQCLTEADRAVLEKYESQRGLVQSANSTISAANAAIQMVRQGAAGGDLAAEQRILNRLRAVQSRHTVEVAANCTAYTTALNEQALANTARDAARAALDTYRTQVFPRYQTAVNQYLSQFNVGFSLASVTSINTGTGTTLNYDVVVNNVPLTVTRGSTAAGEPSFRTILSAGDRSALALAFFLASLQLHPRLAQQIVVIDDPVSSLDAHRSVVTIQRIRRVLDRTAQVIVLSHSKYFLNDIWKDATSTPRSAIQVSRDAAGSTIAVWNVDQDCVSEHDQRHEALRRFVVAPTSNAREVAVSIRPLLETFLRVAYPEHYPPSTLIGPFIGLCRQRLVAGTPILSSADIDELEDIKDYANLFHHDSNPGSYQTVAINDAQLLGFVQRALNFTHR